MTYKDLVGNIAEKTSLTHPEVDKVIKGFMSEVEEEVRQGGAVQLINFATFSRAKVNEREVKAPGKTEKTVIAEHFRMKVSVSKKLKHL